MLIYLFQFSIENLSKGTKIGKKMPHKSNFEIGTQIIPKHSVGIFS